MNYWSQTSLKSLFKKSFSFFRVSIDYFCIVKINRSMFNSCKYNFLQRIVLVSYSFIYLCSCNITKYVPEDEYLLRQSDIELSGSYPNNFFSIDEFNNLLVQKPNRNLFSNFKFYLTKSIKKSRLENRVGTIFFRT